ncbi:hypothetical protein H4W29_004383 [Rhizobium viscosum]|uniref:Uncharacterized protein n=1 Tax=Rhizobium viscosum TaxID=1673 RepID=A0ABR9IVD4_RHIVS|nr:hypothetical protein [Rhizobium viscosum]
MERSRVFYSIEPRVATENPAQHYFTLRPEFSQSHLTSRPQALRFL